MNRQKGTTILEVLVALGLLGMIAGAFLTAISSDLCRAGLVDQRFTAENLARTQVEYIKSLPYDDAGYYPLIDPIPPYYEITVDGIDVSPPDYLNSLQKVIVTVLRNDGAVLTVANYKANR